MSIVLFIFFIFFLYFSYYLSILLYYIYLTTFLYFQTCDMFNAYVINIRNNPSFKATPIHKTPFTYVINRSYDIIIIK